MFKLFGFALLALCALLFGRAYSSYCKRRTALLASFLSLITHLGDEISLFLSTPKSVFMAYKDEQLENCGFLPAVRAGESLKSAFEKCEKSLAVGEEAKVRLRVFFSEFGKSYKDGEVKRCEIFCNELSQMLKSEREEEPKRIKLSYTLLFALVLAIIILLI